MTRVMALGLSFLLVAAWSCGGSSGSENEPADAAVPMAGDGGAGQGGHVGDGGRAGGAAGASGTAAGASGTAAGSGAAGAGGSPSDAGMDSGGDADTGESDAAVYSLGGTCTENAELGCAGLDSPLTLLCSGGEWIKNETCPSTQRCDSRLGSDTQGLCLDLIPECVSEQSGAFFCRDLMRYTCGPARVTAAETPCDTGYVCLDASCAPSLTGLTLSAGTLSPQLDATVTSYSVHVGLGVPNLTLTPSVPEDATVSIGGEQVAAGSAWHSPLLHLGDNVFTLTVSQSGRPERSYTITVTRSLEQVAYVKASNTGSDDSFAKSLAISDDGNTLVIAAEGEDSSGQGVGANQADNSTAYAGAVYVFTLADGVWTQQAYIKASNTAATDTFGAAVAISSDGNTVAVGATGEDSNATGVSTAIGGASQADNSMSASGAVYVFTRSAGVWSQQAYIKASNTGAFDQFGGAVALSNDGNTLAVGARYESSNGTGVNSATQADNSANASGAVYVFTRSSGVWGQQAYVKASNTDAGDEFGGTLALSGDGNTLAVGALGEASAATVVGGDQANDTAANSGAVYVFTRAGTTWSQQAYVKASNADAGDRFGASVALSGDANTLAVGANAEASTATGIGGDQSIDSAPYTGAVYVFRRKTTGWTQEAYVKASNAELEDDFGIAVALSGDGNTLAVGAYDEASKATGVNGIQTDNTIDYSGAAYAFSRIGSTWSQVAYVKASNTQQGAEFGFSIALSGAGNALVVGAYGEASNATGVNGDQTDISAGSSGAAYVFDIRSANP